jgi:hypothetical protein
VGLVTAAAAASQVSAGFASAASWRIVCLGLAIVTALLGGWLSILAGQALPIGTNILKKNLAR